jgi:hypothetical protein
MKPRDVRLPGPLVVRLVLWCLVWVLSPLPVTASAYSFRAEVLGCRNFLQGVARSEECATLPAESSEFSERVLLRLERAERNEPQARYQDDYRVSWLTVLYAMRGDAVECSPHVLATYKVFQCHPDKVWPQLVARRKALLGREYHACYDANDHPLPWDLQVWRGASSPKKPVRSVTPGEERTERAA